MAQLDVPARSFNRQRVTSRRTLPSSLALLALITVLAGLGLGASRADAVTFGADLGAAADNPATCASLSSASCTFFSGAPGPGFYAPGSGTVRTVRVKVGPVTGPMQIVVMRSLYQNKAGDPGHPYFACCFVERYGPTFTPAASAVTPVAASLPMVEDPTPPPADTVTNARGDFLALSVLAPNVPIPANFDNASGYSGFAPAPSPATTPAPSPNPILASSSGFGYHILMSADLDTGAGGAPNSPGAAISPLAIASGGQLLGTTASIPLTCALTTACDGVLKLTNRGVAQAAKAKLRAYGRKRFSIPAGKRRSVKVRLNAAGRRKLGRRSTLTLVATAKIGSQVVSRRVKLRRRHTRK
jgi:hypothetical protein